MGTGGPLFTYTTPEGSAGPATRIAQPVSNNVVPAMTNDDFINVFFICLFDARVALFLLSSF